MAYTLPQKFADVRVYCLPYDRSAEMRQIASENSIDAGYQIGKSDTQIKRVLPGCIILNVEPNFFGDHAQQIFPHRLVYIGCRKRAISRLIAICNQTCQNTTQDSAA